MTLLDFQDARDLRELEERDAEIVAAERADQFAGHEYAEQLYVPTPATSGAIDDAERYRRQERRDRVILACVVAITTSWVALMTILACAVLRGMGPA